MKRKAEDIFIPHPAPDAAKPDDQEKMGAFLSVVKTLFIPALISLILYLLISFVVVPTWTRYRSRYSSYLPLDSISTRTSSYRQRFQDAVVRWLQPSAWREERERYTASAEDDLSSDFDEDMGEELYMIDDRRREALSLDARRGRNEDGSRLSRDLEEGFRDDSDEEDSTPTNTSRIPSR